MRTKKPLFLLHGKYLALLLLQDLYNLSSPGAESGKKSEYFKHIMDQLKLITLLQTRKKSFLQRQCVTLTSSCYKLAVIKGFPRELTPLGTK